MMIRSLLIKRDRRGVIGYFEEVWSIMPIMLMIGPIIMLIKSPSLMAIKHPSYSWLIYTERDELKQIGGSDWSSFRSAQSCFQDGRKWWHWSTQSEPRIGPVECRNFFILCQNLHNCPWTAQLIHRPINTPHDNLSRVIHFLEVCHWRTRGRVWDWRSELQRHRFGFFIMFSMIFLFLLDVFETHYVFWLIHFLNFKWWNYSDPLNFNEVLIFPSITLFLQFCWAWFYVLHSLANYLHFYFMIYARSMIRNRKRELRIRYINCRIQEITV